MNFSDLIKQEALDEAVQSLHKPAKKGTTTGEFLHVFNDEYGTNSWTPKQATPLRDLFPVSDAVSHKDRLMKQGYFEAITVNGKKAFKITQKGFDWIKANKKDAVRNPIIGATHAPHVKGTRTKASDEDGSDGTLSKGTKDITKLKKKAFKVPKVGNNSKYVLQMQTVLGHMYSTSKGRTNTTYMLGGDPGTGKTSFIKSMSTLTGVPLVVIEAPHITQEHLINIPFLVLDGDKRHEGNVQIDDSPSAKMKVVQAESNLVTQLKGKSKRTPEQIQKTIDRNKVLKEIQPKCQFHLDKIEGKFKSILFLDEFYRTASIKIRNVLRNILNGKIGNDKIPQGVYIVMATNINDDGVDDIPLNQDFHLMDYDVSSKEDFMNYMYGKHVQNPDDIVDGEEVLEPELPAMDDSNSYTDESGNPVRIPTAHAEPINIDVWNKFMDSLTDTELGYNDEDNDVRLSPRRLEQMIIAINAMLPVKNIKEAQLLMAFVKTNLSNYIEEKASPALLNKFNEIVTSLITETSAEGVDIDIDKLKNIPLKKSVWREELQNEIELKMKLGEDRAYVPVVSGAPGIGKTSEMKGISRNLDMGFIQVDVSNLTTEDITGMPIADMDGDTITTEFSDPNLYITIMNEYNQLIKEFRRPGRPYNIVLLFDELNRATVPVFNAIRKVLLEKEFESRKLPSDIIVTGAINPTDIGAIELTSHTRDVMDIIPSAGHFPNTINYIRGISELKELSEDVGFDLHGGVTSVMQSLASDFQSPIDGEGELIEDIDVRPFWWSDGSTVFYVSPREMTEAVTNAASQCEFSLHSAGYKKDEQYSDDEYNTFVETILTTVAGKFVETLAMTTLKQDVQGFTRLMGMKIQGNSKYAKMFESIRSAKNANLMNLVQLLEQPEVNGDVYFFDKGVIGEYLQDFPDASEMIQDIGHITDRYMEEVDGKVVITKIIELFEVLLKSLSSLKGTNSHIDRLRKHVGPKIIGLLKSSRVNIIDIMEDDNLMEQIGKI